MSNRKPRPGRFAKRLGPALAIALVLVATTTYSVEAQTYTLKVLHSFTGPPDGQSPQAGLVLDADGNLYGTTVNGGTFNCPTSFWFAAGTCGTVFKISPDGTETILHTFSGSPDGASPQSVLVRDEKGNLYGTTVSGGLEYGPNCGGGSCFGTVFKIDPLGNETILHSFTGFPDDGAMPLAGLRRDKDGNLYGTTFAGGKNTCTYSNFGCGTIFKIDLIAGSEIILYNFGASWVDGEYPYSRLTGDGTGNLYGTTWEGGIGGQVNGLGTVFELYAASTGYSMTTLYSFTDSLDGAFPVAGVVLDAEGNIYGTTKEGGTHCLTRNKGQSGCGTVFELDTAGKETVLHSFVRRNDEAYPVADLMRDKKGNLYGTTSLDRGTIFKVSSAGKETILHNFTGPDGASPMAGLIQDGKGNFYGTTAYGGDLNCITNYGGCGVVFELIPHFDSK